MCDSHTLSTYLLVPSWEYSRHSQKSAGTHMTIIQIFENAWSSNKFIPLSELSLHMAVPSSFCNGKDVNAALSYKYVCVSVCVCVNNVCTLRDACTFFKHFQAEDRAHRHGQKRPVNIYIFCAKVPVCHELVIFLIIAPESPCIAFTSFLIYLSRILRMRNSGNSLIEVCFVFLLL